MFLETKGVPSSLTKFVKILCMNAHYVPALQKIYCFTHSHKCIILMCEVDRSEIQFKTL